MHTLDRRSGTDRRRTPRVRANIPVSWRTPLVLGRGRIIDLSVEGCYVLSAGSFEAGPVKLTFAFGPGDVIELEAEIGESLYDIGFAARFVRVSDEGAAKLRRVVGVIASRSA